jgi:hypothetical protein
MPTAAFAICPFVDEEPSVGKALGIGGAASTWRFRWLPSGTSA